MWIYNHDVLCHYGVKGMKWGVRRYQNSDGTLTAAGKKRARQEVRRDNKTAYELGKNATIYGHATAKAMTRTINTENKLNKKYEVDPDGLNRDTKKLRAKWDASAATTAKLAERYALSRDLAEQHCKSLVEKYGGEAVSSIKYKDIKLPKGDYSPSSFKTINERTNNLSDYAKAGTASVVGTAFAQLMGAPVIYFSIPKSTNSKAATLDSTVYRDEREKVKKGQTHYVDLR